MKPTSDVRKTIALVSCVKQKHPGPCAAKDLYRSSLFRFMRVYAEKHASRWFILSAKYGLLHPDAVVEDYEQTLKELSRARRRAWAQAVFQQIVAANLLDREVEFLWLAGRVYQDDLTALLHEFPQHDPLSGKRIGERLGWLKAQTAAEWIGRS